MQGLLWWKMNDVVVSYCSKYGMRILFVQILSKILHFCVLEKINLVLLIKAKIKYYKSGREKLLLSEHLLLTCRCRFNAKKSRICHSEYLKRILDREKKHCIFMKKILNPSVAVFNHLVVYLVTHRSRCAQFLPPSFFTHTQCLITDFFFSALVLTFLEWVPSSITVRGIFYPRGTLLLYFISLLAASSSCSDGLPAGWILTATLGLHREWGCLSQLKFVFLLLGCSTLFF